MHLEELRFVELVRNYFLKNRHLKILEVGSYDVNGSIRGFFHDSDYIGVDMCKGPGVDFVGSGHLIDFPEESFDLTISCECFEHNPYWHETFINMHRMTKKDGLVVVSCASRGRPEHGTSRTNPDESPGTQSAGINYYQNLNAIDFKRRIDLSSLFSKYKFYYASKPRDLYFIRWKSNSKNAEFDFNNFEKEISEINNIQKKIPLTIKTPFSYIYKMPILISMYLMNDINYQNFIIWYSKLMYQPKIYIKKLLKFN
ncbi:bifunctional 2-polyprenyl-6-hydroxyphenol methylase/3-demethylubiquinol 3-O-methyltransferase UbiG [Polynucleobacter sp. AP-RePozz3-80-G7]|uniref:class I SAM-dependent methyltransferase n=1 Tax=Polynucleobacter sp. AP-RePozz3-80-G7 TaxID=2689105 RepID=UPI001C0BE699|nr:methyltransferase domain-containing protein [Polynucleobacter sp. AP-RePozz3-80-G7]MBU3638543.1 methyltransferase domain-containing protein [Polynucleobacter sp. AP-RePozz3-80-G7]